MHGRLKIDCNIREEATADQQDANTNKKRQNQSCTGGTESHNTPEINEVSIAKSICPSLAKHAQLEVQACEY